MGQKLCASPERSLPFKGRTCCPRQAGIAWQSPGGASLALDTPRAGSWHGGAGNQPPVALGPALTWPGPVLPETLSQGCHKQPDHPGCPSGPVRGSGNPVVLHCGRRSVCAQSRWDTGPRSELRQTLPALSSSPNTEPPDLGFVWGWNPSASPPRAAQPEPPGALTLRHPGWMISLQMEHSMSMRLNLPSSSSTVSSFPASPHTRHTAVWGSTGWRAGEQRSQQGRNPHGEGVKCNEVLSDLPGDGRALAWRCRSFRRPLTQSLARSLTHQATSHLYTPGTALSTKNTVNKTDRPLCHPELTS